MDIIKTNLDQWIRDWLSGIVFGNLESMVNSVNTQTRELADIITARPSAWNPNIWQMITSVADAVIVPIAAGILTFVMCMELIAWAQDKNNLHNSTDVIKQLIWYVLKLGIGVMLVLKSKDITIGIFDLGAWTISQVAGIQTSPDALVLSLSVVKDQLKDMEIGTLIALTFTSLVGGLGIQAVSLITRLIVMGRMLEIYIYCSVGSAPYATLTNSKISSIGANYIKNLLALAFQGFFMFLMLGIYSVLINDTISSVATGGDATSLVLEMLFISFVLCMMLMRSKSIAKSIFSAQ